MANYHDALIIYIEVLKSRLEMLGHEQTSTLTTQHNIANCLLEKVIMVKRW